MSTAVWTSPAYGRRVGLRVAVEATDAVTAMLPFWWAATDGDAERLWDVDEPVQAERVVRDLELWVAEHAVGRVFVHAGVVVHDDRALLLPGRSMTGKTTLTAALLRAGADYASDEYAVLDADGLVHAYPRPLSIRADGRRVHVPARALGARTVGGPVPVAAVAAVHFVPDGVWAPMRLGPAATVLRLLDNTVCARSRPGPALDVVTTVVAGAVAVESVRGDAAAAADALLGLLR